jgi:hypothetical protein
MAKQKKQPVKKVQKIEIAKYWLRPIMLNENGIKRKIDGRVLPKDKEAFYKQVKKHVPDWDNWEDWISKNDYRQRIYNNFKEE